MSSSSFLRLPARARLGLLQICLAGFLWGTGGLAVQLVHDRVPLSVLTISAYRMALAALVLLLGSALAGRSMEAIRLVRRRPLSALLVGLTTAAYQTLYFGSVVTVGVSVATVVTLGLAPALLTVADAISARRGPGLPRILVMTAAIGGLFMVGSSAGFGGTGPQPALGVALAVASGTAFAAATHAGGRLAPHADPLALATTTTIVGAVVLLPFGLGVAHRGAPVVPRDLATLVILCYLGLVTTALAYGLLYAGLRTTPGSSAVVATLIEPVTAAVLAALLLDERLGFAGIAGTALILGAITGLGQTRPSSGRTRRPTPCLPAPSAPSRTSSSTIMTSTTSSPAVTPTPTETRGSWPAY